MRLGQEVIEYMLGQSAWAGELAHQCLPYMLFPQSLKKTVMLTSQLSRSDRNGRVRTLGIVCGLQHSLHPAVDVERAVASRCKRTPFGTCKGTSGNEASVCVI